MDGYSALLSFVPDLKLGMFVMWLVTDFLLDFILCSAGLNVLWSGSYDEFTTSNSGYDIIIPAFVKYLMSVQPPYPYPPNPMVSMQIFKEDNTPIIIVVIEKYTVHDGHS